jgi:hypothetical protein
MESHLNRGMVPGRGSWRFPVLTHPHVAVQHLRADVIAHLLRIKMHGAPCLEVDILKGGAQFSVLRSNCGSNLIFIAAIDVKGVGPVIRKLLWEFITHCRDVSFVTENEPAVPTLSEVLLRIFCGEAQVVRLV